MRLGDPDPAVTIKNKQIVEGPVLRVAVSSILSPKETLTVYQPLLDYLAGQLGYPVVLLQRRTYKYRIMDKLNCKKRSDLVKFALDNGLLNKKN